MRKLKKIKNRSLIFGDFDKDGVPNIDDKYPFDKKKKGRVNPEVSMANTFRYVNKKRKAAKKVARKFAKKNKIKKYRVKDTYSIINKAVRRNPSLTNDLIGFRVETDKRSEAKTKWRKFNQKNKVKQKVVHRETTGTEDHYKIKASDPYKAFHSNFILKGYGAEAQFRTKKMGIVIDKMHEKYKKGKSVKPEAKIVKQLVGKGY